MKEMVAELVQYRHLLYILTWRDIKIRYKQSVMGFLWAILMPLLIVAAGIIVKTAAAFMSGKPLQFTDLASVTVKALPWSFFISSIRFSTSSLLANSNLVTKIYFPREVFPISAVLANLFDFAVATCGLTFILLFTGIGVSAHIFWLPFLIFLLISFTIGAGMLLSCANLFFRDVKYIVEVIVTFAIFFTPVFYEAATFGKWKALMLLNPVAVLLESINSVVVMHRTPDLYWLAYAAAWSVGGLFVSWSIFHKAEFLFAERI